MINNLLKNSFFIGSVTHCIVSLFLFSSISYGYIGGSLALENQFSSVLWIEYGCTGNLIAPNRILIAGHCVNDFKNSYLHFKGQKIRIYTKPTVFIHEAVSLTVKDIKIHPTWEKAVNATNDFYSVISNNNVIDIAVLITEEDATLLTPLSVSNLSDQSDQPLNKNIKFYVGGYGCEVMRTSNTQPRYKFAIKHLSKMTENYLFFNQNDFDKKTTSMGCEGDSGGPVFIIKNNKKIQVGLNSSVEGNETKGTLRVLHLKGLKKWILN